MAIFIGQMIEGLVICTTGKWKESLDFFSKVNYIIIHILGSGNLPSLKHLFLHASTPGESTLEVRKLPYFGWKVEVKSFPTVYDTSMLLNIGMSYTVGKPLHPTFQCPEGRNCVFEYLLLASLSIQKASLGAHSWSLEKTKCILHALLYV